MESDTENRGRKKRKRASDDGTKRKKKRKITQPEVGKDHQMQNLD